MLVSYLTDKGPIRKNNEDFYFVNTDKKIFVVADGMGGHQAGEIASRVAVEQVIEVLSSGGSISTELFERAFVAANEKVLEMGKQNHDYQGMGTTMSAGAIFAEKLLLAHVGDSRVYLLRNGKIEALTKDHTVVEEMMDKGEISARSAEEHPYRHMLLRAIGAEKNIKVDLSEFILKKNDYLLFCTDGLCGILKDEQIQKIIFANGEDVHKSVAELFDAAIHQGSTDNITMVLIFLND